MLSIIITLLVNLLIETSESFIVMVPGDPVEARVGSTVILPCWISPPENAEALEIRWYRHDFNNPVLLYNHGKIQDVQEESYRNRSALKPWSGQSGGLKDGDVSLRLEKLRVQDEGSFHCYVSGDTEYDGREVALKITDSSDSSGPWKALFFTVLICALLGFLGLILYKYRHKLTGKKPAEESCEEETMEKLAKEELERSGSPVEEHLQSAMNHLTNCEEETMKKLTKEVVGEDADIEELRKYADQKFGIDRQHVYQNLTISLDSKSMRDSPRYKYTGEAFPYKLCAFGSQKYSSGRHYWEVLLVQKNVPKNYWLIGVMKDENLGVKKKLALTPLNGYWFLCLEGQNGIYSNTDPQVKLSLTPRPERLGVLLDCDDGQLSFYNVTERKHLLTISSRFSGSVVPLFNPGVGDKSSLKILNCPKPAESESVQPLLSPASTPAKSSTSNTSNANRNSNTVSHTV